MRNGPDSTAVVRAPEPESFGNRKLIRPSLSREQARVAEAGCRTARTHRYAHPNAPLREHRPRNLHHAEQTHAENFYYQKQMQSKTPMVVVTRDGEQLHGVIEWYDKNCIKLNRAGGESNFWSINPAFDICTRKPKRRSKDREDAKSYALRYCLEARPARAFLFGSLAQAVPYRQSDSISGGRHGTDDDLDAMVVERAHLPV